MNATNIVEYDEFRAKLNEVKETCDFLPDVSTDEGYQKSKRISLDVGKVLTTLEKTRKEQKSHALELGRNVDSQAKSIAEELEAFQLPHKEAYKDIDNAKKEREAARKAALERRVEEIRGLPEAMRDSDSEGVKMALESLQVEECLDFYEFTEQALKARNASREALSTMFGEKLKHEQEQAELERLRKEKAERDQKDHEARIAQEAADKTTREAEAKAKKEQERIEEERREAERREQSALEEKQEAEHQLAEQAERAEREKQEAIELERRRQEDQRKAEEAAAIAREKDKKHKNAIDNTALDCLVAGGIDPKVGKTVIELIAKRQVTHVSIAY